jgi:hypothetical protein
VAIPLSVPFKNNSRSLTAYRTRHERPGPSFTNLGPLPSVAHFASVAAENPVNSLASFLERWVLPGALVISVEYIIVSTL